MVFFLGDNDFVDAVMEDHTADDGLDGLVVVVVVEEGGEGFPAVAKLFALMEVFTLLEKVGKGDFGFLWLFGIW